VIQRDVDSEAEKLLTQLAGVPLDSPDDERHDAIREERDVQAAVCHRSMRQLPEATEGRTATGVNFPDELQP
jgi:hypothetical protein